MLETVHIENFKSLKDVTLNLQKVNLLIGPNNSGKSNFLKAIAFIKEHLNLRIQPALLSLDRIYFNQKISAANSKNANPILFEFRWNTDESFHTLYHLELFGFVENNTRLKYSELVGNYKGNIPFDWKLKQIDNWIGSLQKFYVTYEENRNFLTANLKNPVLREFLEADDEREEQPKEHFLFFGYRGRIKNRGNTFGQGRFLSQTEDKMAQSDLSATFENIKIYKPDPSKISAENLLLFDQEVNPDCSNLVAFLDNMRDEHPNVWMAIERDLNKCIPEFAGINFGKVKISGSLGVNGKNDSIGKRFGLRDKEGRTYWAEELSEGTIYFLALLAIVHQPNPPKLLLLEEPEKGIHPRRISEVMDLVFRLANEKDIQIIITSHSTQVVDAFQDIPESVFIFDKVDGETKVKNLQTDIIEPDNANAKKKNYPKLDFSKHTLGEHWAIGFLGGVPA